MTAQIRDRIIIGIVIVIAAAAVIFVSLRPASDTVPSEQTQAVPREVTVTGMDICLPHKDTSGPQTLECAFGMKANDGSNYALDLGDLPDKGMNANLGGQKTITVSGLLVPIEQISSDQWQKYDIKGIIKVNSLEVKP